jgi:DNA-binding MarR family transcriptional regulator
MATAKSKTRSNDSVWLSTDSPVRELVRTFGLFERVMQPYFAQFGISGAQWGVLRSLHRAEAEGLLGLRFTELSQRLLIRPPSVTGVVDRMERAGLVAREGELSDLRAKKVVLTAKGRELVARVLEQHHDQVASIMEGLTPKEQLKLQRLLSKLGRHLQVKLQGQA